MVYNYAVKRVSHEKRNFTMEMGEKNEAQVKRIVL